LFFFFFFFFSEPNPNQKTKTTEAISICDNKSLDLKVPSEGDIQAFEAKRKADFDRQLEFFVEEKKKKARLFSDKTLDGKEQDLLKQLKGSEKVTIATFTKEPPFIERCDELKKISLDEKEAAKVEVFINLWERGFFITEASKFGADFLVYPGLQLENLTASCSDALLCSFCSLQEIQCNFILTLWWSSRTLKKLGVLWI
jgi:hypothetical protein